MKQFWSFTVYGNESRCLIDTDSYPDRFRPPEFQRHRANKQGLIDPLEWQTPTAVSGESEFC